MYTIEEHESHYAVHIQISPENSSLRSPVALMRFLGLDQYNTSAPFWFTGFRRESSSAQMPLDAVRKAGKEITNYLHWKAERGIAFNLTVDKEDHLSKEGLEAYLNGLESLCTKTNGVMNVRASYR